MGTSTVIHGGLPLCDFPHNAKVRATVDGKTKTGPWANMCDRHFDEYGVGLGTGRGQALIPCHCCGRED